VGGHDGIGSGHKESLANGWYREAEHTLSNTGNGPKSPAGSFPYIGATLGRPVDRKSIETYTPTMGGHQRGKRLAQMQKRLLKQQKENGNSKSRSLGLLNAIQLGISSLKG
jgi:hypothetical protein